MVRYISLGGNCAVAYQLQVRKLRIEAYPFDWLKFKLMSQIIEVLENDFCDFLPFQFQQIVQTHPWLPTNKFSCDHDIPTIKAQNSYGILSYHDYRGDIDMTQQPEVENKYKRRIERFRMAIGSDEELVFIWSEERPTKLRAPTIERLGQALRRWGSTFRLVLVCHNPNQSNLSNLMVDYDFQVRIVNDESPYDSWQRFQTNWDNIFDLL